MINFRAKNNEYGLFSTLSKILGILFSATVMLYIATQFSSTLGESLAPFKKAIDSVMNKRVLEYIRQHNWIMLTLISVLLFSIILKIISMCCKNRFSIREIQGRQLELSLGCKDVTAPEYTRINFVNDNYNGRNRFDLHFIGAILLSTCSEKNSNRMYKTTSKISFVIKKVIICAAITLCATSIIDHYTGKSFLPFNVIPDFMRTDVLMIVFSAAAAIVSLFAISKMIVDILNVIGYGYKSTKETIRINQMTILSGEQPEMKAQPQKFRELEELEYNRKPLTFLLDKLQECYCTKRNHSFA